MYMQIVVEDYASKMYGGNQGMAINLPLWVVHQSMKQSAIESYAEDEFIHEFCFYHKLKELNTCVAYDVMTI